MLARNFSGATCAAATPASVEQRSAYESPIVHHTGRDIALQSPNDESKRRAREQWGENPCGAHVARGLPAGSREYFEAIEEYRYAIYAPWMKDAIRFGDHSGKRVLEVGCGTGTDLLQFARAGASVTGVDLTPRSIEIASRRFAVYGEEASFAIGDAERLAFPDESFDLVYSFGVIHHTPGTAKAVDEMRRVLRRGGRAVVMIYNRASLYYWGSIILKHGLARGELFKRSAAEIMSRHVEHTETGGRPLVKAYTPREARRLFRDFSECEVRVHQLTRAELAPIGRVLPESLFQWLARTLGWNLLITATK
ncbi:MAG TPA: class I SAM-dependent methyltransferase [Blastocatellia bacterium]|nr:class I SAM-dependent methyltransferase [Blastocatellia bacterium]